MAVDAISPAASSEPRNDFKGSTITVEAAVKAVKAGNAKDIDIAAQIIADYADEIGSDGWSKEEEAKLIRKVDWWLIPIVSRLLFTLFNCLARPSSPFFLFSLGLFLPSFS